MRGIVGTLIATAALTTGVSGAQAAIVYTKGGKVYTATNAGKHPKAIANGDAATITPDGQFVVYTDSTDKLLKIPVGGGASTQFGGTATWCVKCSVFIAPDSKTLLVTGGNGELDLVPLDGTAPTRLSAKTSTWATYSPDSKQVAYDEDSADTTSIFTVPVAGGPRTQLALPYGTTPVWTSAGIVASTVSATGKKLQFKIVLLDAAGNVKRVLQRVTASSKTIKTGVGIQDASFPAGPSVITFAIARKGKSILRLVSIASGSVKAKLTFSKNEYVTADNPAGNTVLVVNKKGRLQIVSIKTGKRKTVVKSGVGYADMSR